MRLSDETYDLLEDVAIKPDEPVFTTGVVCRILDIPVWVLKQLDSAGLVSPQRKTSSEARLYSYRELKLLNYCWKYMKEHKVKVPGLKVILKIEFK